MELTRKELYDLVWSEPMSTLCKRFGLSDNGLRKQCKSMDIPTPPLGYWAKLKAGYKVKITPFPAKTKSKKQSTVLNEIPQNDETKVEVAPPNRFKLRELEISSGDTSVYIVPEVLYAKDPLIIDTKEKCRLEKEENIYLNRNPYKSEIKATLNLYVDSLVSTKKIRNYRLIGFLRFYVALNKHLKQKTK